ncbi:Ig-like domain-containing protein [Anaerocolumna xylanovorans]|uniref:Uncharacterized conserved protein YjdB, contains Ig-like domain n=1 Tax=Anaerocolumna xylanovorans DSM 12503 TaxID=1121345 RepID=A0A1M7YIS9_9FIRM|nr:Ig-like domain-containing protein [Anaerocolumna xylanovorans]SHO52522.1 Uncharacterized conserved protein YjdB, contains Ig-like domain [Anaerocolumna xylanovorans DSM 12503]
MKKIFTKRWMAVVCCLVMVVTSVFQPLGIEKAEAASPYHFVVAGAVKESGSEVTIKSLTTDINLSSDTGIVKNIVSQQWFVNNVEVKAGMDESQLGVVSIDPTSIVNANGLSAKLMTKGPGYARVRLHYEDSNNMIWDYYLNVKVDFAVDKSNKTDFPDVLVSGSSYDMNVMLFKNINESKYLRLKYADINPDTISLAGSSVSIESSNTDVVTVNPTTGEVVSRGAGVAQITVKTNNAPGDNISSNLTSTFKVVVTPKVSATLSSNPTDYSYTIDKSTTGSITFYTNAAQASKLIWKFYYKTDSGPQLIPNPAGIISYTASEVDGSITINNTTKAADYIIMGFADSMYIPDHLENPPDQVKVPYIKINLKVVPAIPAYLVMNVNDTYNIGNLLNSAIDTYTYVSSDSSIASISNGILTAKKSGDAVITISKADGTKYTMNLTVVDGISLNLTEANIYVSGTLQLTPKTTSDNTEVKWYSVKTPTADYDESTNNGSGIASVKKDGTVTGVSEGTAYIVASITTATGVVKKAICKITVGKTITSIKVEPAELPLNIAESYTLKATFDPAISRTVPVKWISTDEKIVKINSSNSELVNISAMDIPGTALVMAINTENYIIGYSKVTVKQKVSSLTLSATNLSLMKSAGTYQLRATVLPASATNQKVIWMSTNPAVATVSDTGLVTLLTSGSTSIIATSQDNPDATAVCNVTVGVSSTAIKLDDSKKVMYTGDTTKLSYTITPTNATNTDVVWSTSDSSIVSVDAKGNVKAVAAGTAVIILKTADGLYMSTCTITVKEKATGLAFDVTSLELYIGKTYTIKVTPIPATATDYTLTWSSLDATIASVDNNGTITAKAAGKTIITATTSTGSILYCTVTVKAEATGVILNYTEKTLVIGDYFDLKASVKPSAAADEVSIVWVSSKTSVATVSTSGRVKGIKGGTAVITCKTSDGKFTSFCTVTVIERVTSVTLNKTSLKLGLGKNYTLVAKVKTNAASNPKIKWTTSNSKIVTVDQKGNIAGKALGTVNVTAAATDGSGEKAIVQIRVVRNASSITLNRTAVTTIVGKNFTLKATVKPTNATYKTVFWKSSDESIAIVDSSGKVTALKAGNATIKASAKDNSGRYSICYVIVQPRVPANSVTVLNQNLTMVVGETSVLQKAMNPSTSTDSASWASDNRTVATVTTSGKLTARKPGIANVTVMTESGKTATTKVTVVGLNSTNLVLEQYSNYTLMVLGISSGVTWDVTDSEVAIVNNGVVSTRRIGTTTVIATVNGRRLTCKVTVKKIK